MRYTLSSLLSKLISVEDTIKRIYLDAIEKTDSPTLKSFLKELSGDVDKRINDINWVKDFIVIEMTLEPMEGPDLNQYVDEIRSIFTKVDANNVRKVEEKRVEMYNEIIKMVSRVSPEVEDIVNEFIRRSKENLAKLK